jgi:hypothetical protein
MTLAPAPSPTVSLRDSHRVMGSEPAKLTLRDAELLAAIRVLYVVKDNFWLDDVEESLLTRLLEAA